MKNSVSKVLIMCMALVASSFMSGCGDDLLSIAKDKVESIAELSEEAAENSVSETTEAVTDETTCETEETEDSEVVFAETDENEDNSDSLSGEENPDSVSDENEDDYKEEYKSFISSMGYDKDNELTFDLIYFDNNDVPELLVSDLYFISLYTYAEGEIHTIMDGWIFGAMGKEGYSYSPYNNSVFNSDADCGGAIRYNAYMSMDDDFELVVSDYYVSYMFEDANKNHFTDVNEKVYDEYVNYIDDERLATDDEIAAMAKGEYEFMSGNMTLEELYAQLS